MMLVILIFIFATSYHFSHAYVEFGAITLPFEPIHQPTPQPHQLPHDHDLRYEILPSMITAVAPSMNMASNGSFETMYSLHYHDYFVQSRVGKGIFNRRGVFASDPPIATCTPCGNSSTTTSSLITSSLSCSTHTYTGVFRFFAGATTTSDYCYASNYSGVLKPSSTSTPGLPCCFTIPSSCLANHTSTSFTYTSGVFRPSTTSSVFTTSTFSISPSSSSSLFTVSSTTSNSALSSTSRTSNTSKNSGTISQVISSTTDIRTSDSSTITVITVIPPPQTTVITITTVISHTIEGCGTASGSGIVNGSGTVYAGAGGLIPIVSSGVASGFASKVVGCGTVIATSGSFSGSGTIIGCGTGSGTATMTGSGTVWPAYGGWVLSFVSSGILTGSGRVIGCGTLTGSGTFSATKGLTVISTIDPSPVTTTVEVYLSYCPANANVLQRIGGNWTLPVRIADNSSIPSNTTTDNNPICNVCFQQAGICCPPGTECTEDGRCPWTALQNSGYIFNGYNLVEMRNSSGPGIVRKSNHVVRPYL